MFAEPRLDVIGVAEAGLLLVERLVDALGDERDRVVGVEDRAEHGIDKLAIVALGLHDRLGEEDRVGRNRLTQRPSFAVLAAASDDDAHTATRAIVARIADITPP